MIGWKAFVKAFRVMLTCDNWSELQTEFAFPSTCFASNNLTRCPYLPLGILQGEANLSLQGTQETAFVRDETQKLEK